MASASCPLQRAVKSIQILQPHQFAEASVGLSNVPEFTGSGRFEFRGFAGSSDPFSFQNERPRFFLLPEEAERVQGPPELIKIRLGPPTSSGSIGDPLSFLAQ
jgi:hypothetical protein